MSHFQLEFPAPPIILTFLLLGIYAFTIWWLLRKESSRHLATLFIITLVAATLRLYNIYDLPPGLNDDEVKTLKGAKEFLDNRRISTVGVEGPYLLSILFQAPLATILDSTFWSMRLYPIISGVLAVPLSFAVGRAMMFGALPSFTLALLVATMPWSIFWSRISWGGEIIFNQTLLLVALGRILWRAGGKIEMLIGAVGLAGMLWDYPGAWSMLGMPLVALLLATNARQRALCLGVTAFALLLWIPWVLEMTEWGQHVSTKVTSSYSPDSSLAIVSSFIQGPVRLALRTFLLPEGNVYWISMHSVAIHPLIVLIGAALGLMTGPVRRSAFLFMGFCGGLVPALVSFQGAASTHRMITCFIFISISCAAFLDLIERRCPRASIGRIVIACCTMVAFFQGTSRFFSERFWEGSSRIFMRSETLLSESIRLPVKRRTIVDGEIFRFLEARNAQNHGLTNLTYETMMPQGATDYGVSSNMGIFRDFLSESLPSNQSSRFNGADDRASLHASLSESDATTWSQYGWRVERVCGERKMVSAHIPVFLVEPQVNWALGCAQHRENIFSATWTREPTELNLQVIGQVPVKVSSSMGKSFEKVASDPSPIKLSLSRGEQITITVGAVHGGFVRLVEGTVDSLKLPQLTSFKPAQN
jgi:hypothetical protein